MAVLNLRTLLIARILDFFLEKLLIGLKDDFLFLDFLKLLFFNIHLPAFFLFLFKLQESGLFLFFSLLFNANEPLLFRIFGVDFLIGSGKDSLLDLVEV